MLHIDFYTRIALLQDSDLYYKVFSEIGDDEWTDEREINLFKNLSEDCKHDFRVAIFHEVGVLAIRSLIYNGSLDHTKIMVHQINHKETVDVSFDKDGRSNNWGNWISPTEEFLYSLLGGK